MGVIEVTYFSDVLCIWAYASQARVDAVKEQFGDAVQIKHRFCSVFGDTAGKINADEVFGIHRPDRIVVTPPAFDDDAGLAQRVENFTIEQFIAKATSLTPIWRIASAMF